MVLTSYLKQNGSIGGKWPSSWAYMGWLASTCLSLLMSMSILSVGEVNTSHTTPMICSLLCSSIVLLLVGASVRWLIAWFACFLVCLLDILVLVCVLICLLVFWRRISVAMTRRCNLALVSRRTARAFAQLLLVTSHGGLNESLAKRDSISSTGGNLQELRGCNIRTI